MAEQQQNSSRENQTILHYVIGVITWRQLDVQTWGDIPRGLAEKNGVGKAKTVAASLVTTGAIGQVAFWLWEFWPVGGGPADPMEAASPMDACGDMYIAGGEEAGAEPEGTGEIAETPASTGEIDSTGSSPPSEGEESGGVN